VHLTPKPLDTLILLVERHGHIVEKQELLDTIWKDTAVTEDTIVQAVHEIRRVLGDDKVDPRYLQTVPRRGYRFVAEVITTEPPEALVDRPPAAVRQPDQTRALTATPRATSRRVPVWLGAGLASLAAIAAVWLVFSFRIRRTEASVTPTTLVQLTPESVSAGKPALSTGGDIVYNSGGALFLRPAGSDAALQITDRILPSGDMPVFTADGSQVVFSLPRNGEDGSRLYDLYAVRSVGGQPMLYLPSASGAGFSPDGRWVAYTKHLPEGPALWISAVDDLERHDVVRAGGFVPRWSPDGRWIAYTTADPNATSGELWMASVTASATGELRIADHTRLTHEAQPMYGLTWTRDGRSIIFAGRRPGGPTHLYRVWTSGGITALTSGPGDYACPSVSPDGTNVIFWNGAPVKNLMIADDPGAEVRSLTDDEYHLWPALSPSAKQVASVVRRPTYEEHLYVSDVASARRVALNSGAARHPGWIDDDTVAYLEDTPAGDSEVRVVSIAAQSRPLRLTAFTGRASWVAVRHDRAAVAVVTTDRRGHQRIVLRELGRTEADRIVAEGAEYEHLRWLPDGLALSWSGPERSSDPHSNGVWVARLDGGAPRRIVADGYGPVWSAGGNKVFFSRIRDHAGLWQYDIDTGRSIRLREWAEGRYEFDIAGDRLVFTQEAGRGRIFSMSLDR
jgi:DNA-binding winged helix-turn-helix (wHTH) protein/Tol biopolymer transport system component